MKKQLLIALLLTLSAGMAMAQPQWGSDSGQGGKNRQGQFQAGGAGSPVERLTEDLGLDEAQIAAVELIFEEAQQSRTEERERSRVVMGEIREATHTSIMEQLTPEQQALFEQQRLEREALRQALEDVRGYGARQGRRSCDG